VLLLLVLVLNGLRCEGKGGVEMEKVPLRQYYKHLTCVRRVMEWSMVVCR
jgi:hypothetical protein